MSTEQTPNATAPTTAETVLEDANNAKAFEMAQTFAPLADLVTRVLDAGELGKRGPLDVMQAMVEADIDITAVYPLPGSKTGNNPDIYDGKRKNEQGEWKAYKGSHVKDAVLKTPEAQALRARLDDVASKTGQWASSQQRRDAEKKHVTGRLNAMVSLYTRAIKLSYWFAAIDDLPKADWEPVTDTVTTTVNGVETVTEVPARTTAPIVVYNPDKRNEFEIMSIGQFLQLDPFEAKEKGGTYAALIKTLGREGGNGQGDTKSKVKVIKSIETLLSVLDEVHEYLNPETDEGRKHMAQLAQFMANKKLGEDVVVTIGNGVMALDAPYTRIEARYTDIKQREAGKHRNNGNDKDKDKTVAA